MRYKCTFAYYVIGRGETGINNRSKHVTATVRMFTHILYRNKNTFFRAYAFT